MTTTHTYEPVTTRWGRIPTGKSKDGRAVRSGDETVLFWIEGIYELEPRPRRIDPTSIIAEGDAIFSYGHHFCMARMVRDAKGKVVRVLVNADTWSGGGWTSTGQHQGMVRSAITAHANGVEVLEIPFSVLDAAGIDHKSVRPLEIRTSRYTTHEITSEVRPSDKLHNRYDPDTTSYVTDEGSYEVPYEKSGMAHASAITGAKLGDDGLWHWKVQRHWMGDSIIRAKSTETRQRALTKDELALRDEWAAYVRAAEIMMDRYRESFGGEGKGYDESWFECRDRLRVEAAELQSQLPPATRIGSDVVSFTVKRWATYLSSFDYDEPHRPYFFCELPHGCKAETVDEGFAALMPMQVSLHIGLGDDVKRQGDIYAIATKFSTDELESMARPCTVDWWRYEQNPPEIGGETYVSGTKDVLVRRRFAKSETYRSGALDIFGSNHQCTKLIVTKDGRYFGQGRMYHAPNGRNPDHRVIDLEPGVWYEFVKNTVPTMKTRGRSRVGVGNSTFQSGQSRAWAVGGGVD